MKLKLAEQNFSSIACKLRSVKDASVFFPTFASEGWSQKLGLDEPSTSLDSCHPANNEQIIYWTWFPKPKWRVDSMEDDISSNDLLLFVTPIALLAFPRQFSLQIIRISQRLHLSL